MADATANSGGRAFGLPKSAKFDVAADADVLLPVGDYVILGFQADGNVSGFTVGANDYVMHTAATNTFVCPAVVDGAAVVATATGAGTITLFYYELPAMRSGVGV